MDEAGNSRTPQSAQAPAHQRRTFISYAFHDAAIGQKVCSALEAAGFPRWIAPRNVVPGTMYADGIVRASLGMGRRNDALEQINAALTRDPKADSDGALALMIKGQTDLRPFQIAQVSAFRGETDEAFKWLNRAYEHKDGSGLPFIKTDPVFNKFEGERRYKAFLKKMNLPE
jgi:hypothetical protein